MVKLNSTCVQPHLVDDIIVTLAALDAPDGEEGVPRKLEHVAAVV
jgi:hypothetical protein